MSGVFLCTICKLFSFGIVLKSGFVRSNQNTEIVRIRNAFLSPTDFPLKLTFFNVM